MFNSTSMRSNGYHIRDLRQLLSSGQRFKNDLLLKNTERITSMVEAVFGTYKNQGIIHKLYSQIVLENPVEWVQDLEYVLQLIGPKSNFFQQILQNADLKISIEKNYLPKCLLRGPKDQDLNEEFAKIFGIVDRGEEGKVTVDLFSWFFMFFCYGLCTMEEVECKWSYKEFAEQDDFYFYLTRNPFLVLLRHYMRYLKEEKKNSQEMKKLLNLLELYLMEETTYKYKADRFYEAKNKFHYNNKPMQSKPFNARYKLKCQQLHAIYLLLHYRGSSAKQNYQEYLSIVSDNYSSIGSYSSQMNIRNIIRLWLYLITYENSIEQEVIMALDNSSSTVGWFTLKLYSILQFQDKTSVLNFQHQFKLLHHIFKNAKASIMKLLKKESAWSPNPSYLHVIACYICLEKIFSPFFHKINSQNLEEGDYLYKSIERILHQSYDSSSVAYRELLESTRELFKENYKKEIKWKNNDEVVNGNGNNYEVSEGEKERKHFVSYHQSRGRSCWEYPLQNNEISYLYTLFFFIAQKADKLIPGKRKYPTLNLRFLCNPLVLFLALLALMILFKYFS